MIATVEHPNTLIIRANRITDQPEIAEMAAAALQRGDRVSVFACPSGSMSLVCSMRRAGASILVTTDKTVAKHPSIHMAVAAGLERFEPALDNKILWAPRNRRDD